jgi:hypothetical protein
MVVVDICESVCGVWDWRQREGEGGARGGEGVPLPWSYLHVNKLLAPLSLCLPPRRACYEIRKTRGTLMWIHQPHQCIPPTLLFCIGGRRGPPTPHLSDTFAYIYLGGVRPDSPLDLVWASSFRPSKTSLYWLLKDSLNFPPRIYYNIKSPRVSLHLVTS